MRQKRRKPQFLRWNAKICRKTADRKRGDLWKI